MIKTDQNSERRMMTYRVEQIFAIEGSSSEELIPPGHEFPGAKGPILGEMAEMDAQLEGLPPQQQEQGFDGAGVPTENIQL